MAVTDRASGGRPPEREEAKRSAVAVRTTPAIKARLVQAAEASGRSVTQEIESRLEASFRHDRHLGGAVQDEMIRLISLYMDVVSEQADAPWHGSWAEWAAVRSSVLALLDAVEPAKPVQVASHENRNSDDADILIRMKMVGRLRLGRMKADSDGA